MSEQSIEKERKTSYQIDGNLVSNMTVMLESEISYKLSEHNDYASDRASVTLEYHPTVRGITTESFHDFVDAFSDREYDGLEQLTVMIYESLKQELHVNDLFLQVERDSQHTYNGKKCIEKSVHIGSVV